MLVGCWRALGTDLGRDAEELQRVFDALPDATATPAFVRTLRAVVDWRGQVITMLDRCYLTRGMPTLLIWGTRDAVVPFDHARSRTPRCRAAGSRSSTAPGHFPHHHDPERFLALLRDFLASTDAGVVQRRASGASCCASARTARATKTSSPRRVSRPPADGAPRTHSAVLTCPEPMHYHLVVQPNG